MPEQSPHRASVITVINLKGGVGKTHASWLLAAVCEERKQRVLLVDTDMQANLTSSFVDEGQREPGVEALFDPRKMPIPVRSFARVSFRRSTSSQPILA